MHEVPLTTLTGKAIAAAGAGLIGAALMAAVDPPKSRADLFAHAVVACAGSIVFGPVAARAAAHYLTFIDAANLETAAPVYFLVGALSWGAMGFLRTVSRALRGDGALRWINRKLGE